MIWKRRLCLSITPTYMITILLNMKTVSVSVVKKKVNEYCSTMYCIDDVHCICLECISDGKAAEKFEGVFIQDAESGLVSDPQKQRNCLSGLRDMQAGRVNTGWLRICG